MIKKTFLKPEMLIPRLGDLLIQEGLITKGALEFCLKKQAHLKDEGTIKQLGQILVEEGLIDEDTLNGVITEQIIGLRNALVNANQKLEERVRERTAELEIALGKLEELNQTKSRILSNLSHELRTPLNHIKGYLELLTSDTLGTLNKEQLDAVKIIQKGYNKLEALINDLLQLSELSHTDFAVRITAIKLEDFMSTGIRDALQEATERNISLDINVPKTMPKVLGDQDKLTSVFHQLLDNALKFTPPGGCISVQAIPESERVLFRINDTGIGIPEERIAEVFEPFHQLDESTARRYGGTGLGLAIVKRILDEHQAPYSVKSKVNEGTEFIFYLPIAGDEQTAKRS